MKSLFLIFFLLLPLLFAGCKDQITGAENSVKEITTPGVCPQNPYPQPPNTGFNGVSGIDSIEQTRFKVRWNTDPKASAYMLFVAKAGEEMGLYKTIDKAQSSVWVNGLSPQTEYTVSVKLLDERGLYDMNDTRLNAVTSGSPVYHNSKSLYFDGFASVGLGASQNALPAGPFTASLWIKTGHREDSSDARLLNFHHGFAAGTALAMGVKEDKLFLRYRSASGAVQDVEKVFDYHDGNWHHIALSYDGSRFELYLNGQQAASALSDFSGLGQHSARIGSYTGAQRGFTGMIDEVSLWSTSMNSQEIGEIFNSSTTSDLHLHSLSSGLRVWHRMGDDSKDGAGHLEDQMGNVHGAPINITSSDFELDTP